MEELVDVYDRDLNYLGITVPRKGAFMKEGQFVLYVLAIVQDLEGRFLITQRSQEKHWAAGWWEVSGGGVSAGETYEEAVIREVREEVGLDVSNAECQFCYRYENVDLPKGDNYINNVFRFKHDFTVDDVVLQEEEAVACKLATWEEIEELNEQGIFLHFERIRKAIEG